MSLRSVRSHTSLLFTAVCALLAPFPTLAWDGIQTSTLQGMEVTAGTNYGFRISLAGVSNMCTGGSGMAYLNDTDSNYKIYVAVLMLANAQGKRVSVYTNLEGGECHIKYISVVPS